MEKSAGVWAPEEVSKAYYGDILKESTNWTSSGNVNDDMNVSNRISIISDGYGNSNFGYIKWVEWMGQKWKVTSIEAASPRLILTIGGLYNGN